MALIAKDARNQSHLQTKSVKQEGGHREDSDEGYMPLGSGLMLEITMQMLFIARLTKADTHVACTGRNQRLWAKPCDICRRCASSNLSRPCKGNAEVSMCSCLSRLPSSAACIACLRTLARSFDSIHNIRGCCFVLVGGMIFDISD